MYALTGATGRLGRLVLDELLARMEPQRIVAFARDPAQLLDAAERGVVVRAADYDVPQSLLAGFRGIERLLFISASEVGRRERQHRAVIDAARTAGVRFIAYTSILHADRSPIKLAQEHRATESAIQASGIPYALLRHGWYSENFTAWAPSEIARGTVIGSAGDGLFSSAARADFAAAAAAVLTDETIRNQTFELAGDDAFTLSQYASELSAASGKPVRYVDMPVPAYRDELTRIGLPLEVATMLAESNGKAAQGALFDQGRALSRLIGRPTTPMRDTIREVVSGAA